MTKLDEQKILADNILSGLKLMSPYAILAGGAPRDWYFNQEANDLDFYLYTHAGTIYSTKKQIAGCLGINQDRITLKAEPQNDLYKTMRCLRRVFDVSGYDMPVQIMQLNSEKDEFKVVDLMSTSICRIYYHEGKLVPKDDFILTGKSGVMFIDEGYNWSDPHPRKMVERFKHKYTTGTKQQAKDRIINKVSRGEICERLG